MLNLMAKKYRDSNPEGRAQVISYEPRPLIKIIPLPSSKNLPVCGGRQVLALHLLHGRGYSDLASHQPRAHGAGSFSLRGLF